jgi:hypothetical protein
MAEKQITQTFVLRKHKLTRRQLEACLQEGRESEVVQAVVLEHPGSNAEQIRQSIQERTPRMIGARTIFVQVPISG